MLLRARSGLARETLEVFPMRPLPAGQPRSACATPRHFEIGGDRRSGHRFKMTDAPLAKALARQKISGEEFRRPEKIRAALVRWRLGGAFELHRPQSHLGVRSLPDVRARQERSSADHRAAYHAARLYLGRRPAFVADRVACFEVELEPVGHALGFRSNYRARVAALENPARCRVSLAAFWENWR